MKNEIRVLGIDDSPFTFNDKFSDIIGVVMRGGSYIECVLKNTVEIDGDNSTDKCVDMINHTRHKLQLKAVLIDGVSFGGFNVIDTEKIYDSTCIPIITVTRDKPDFEKIKMALEKHFKDWEERYKLIMEGDLHEVKTVHNPIYVKCVGMTIKEAKEIIKISTIRGVIPEPIRVAHMIASGISRGESYGKA